MAYALRYYKDLPRPDGTVVSLEIYKKDGPNAAIEIGEVIQALYLEIQGQRGDVDTPIIKTSLTMTLVDATDLGDGKKCGGWEEFYSPDSTKWKVVLKADGKTIWGGYITPDSYQEDLCYRGSVTIIARDNIGYMQSFPFDMEGNTDGMVTLEELVEAAWAKIESPMILDWRHEAQEAQYLFCDGVEAPHTYMNVSAFEDMNYYDAVEKALYSYGLVMRYTGSNRVTIMSLRDMPFQGMASAPRHIEPIFVACAQRELAPAARRIEESVKYDFTDGVQIPLAKGVEFSGESYTVPFYSTNIFGETTTKNIPVHPIANTIGEGWGNVQSSTLFFNPARYTAVDSALRNDMGRMLFLACDTDESHSVTYRKTMVCRNFRISMTFGRVVQRFGDMVQYCYGFASGKDDGIGSIRAKKVSCYITVEQNGITEFYNGSGWQAEAYKLDLEPSDSGEFGVDIGNYRMTGVAQVAITIVNIKLDAMRDYSDGDGLYIPISSMYWGIAKASSLCATNKVNTVYIDTNNVIISRSPEFAPALDEVPFPAVIKNGIFVKSGNAYLPAKEWAWQGGIPQQMAVYNHLQLLCYFSKPNNVISGDIVYSDIKDMRAVYEWGGAKHLLVSGNYNLLNGRIESAVLREFARYEDMWSDVPGSSLPETEAQDVTNYESGSAGSAGSQTYSNVTNVSVGSGGGASSEEIKQILEWFYQYDENTIGTRFNFFSEKQIASGEIGEESGESGESSGSETGGSAALENNVSADTTVGFISKNTTLYKGLTFTDFVELMFSQGVKTYEPSVSIDNVPSRPYEVGSEITLNVSASFKDGYFAGTDEGTTNAGCQPGAAVFTLDGQTVAMPHVFVADTAKTHAVRVSQPYGASAVKPVKGGEELTDSIPGGTAEDSASFIVGYRAFWGYVTDAEAESMDSAAIRGLEHPDTIINPGQSTVTLLNGKYEIPGGQDIIIAVPSGYVLGEVKDEDGDFSKAFKALPDVEVKCAGAAKKTYKVFRFDNGTPYSMEILSITIKKA